MEGELKCCEAPANTEKQTDLALVEIAVNNLREYIGRVLVEYETLYQQIIVDLPTESKEDVCKREKGKNRVDEIRLTVLDIRAILENLMKYKARFEEIIG